MRAKAMLVMGAVILGAAAYVGTVWATPAIGFSGTTVALGRFAEIDVDNHSFFPDTAPWNTHPGNNLWLSMQKTKGPSDLYVQSNVWAPGGTTGWHTHPGHSLITVTAGALTVYDGHDPTCSPRTYTVGQGFVDAGGDHVHAVRNEGFVEARSITVQLIPAGATRRIDAAGPSQCPF